MFGYPEEETDDYYWDQGQHDVERYAAGYRRFAGLPVVQLFAIFYAYTLRVLQVLGEFLGAGVAIFWIALDGAFMVRPVRT